MIFNILRTVRGSFLAAHAVLYIGNGNQLQFCNQSSFIAVRGIMNTSFFNNLVDLIGFFFRLNSIGRVTCMWC